MTQDFVTHNESLQIPKRRGLRRRRVDGMGCHLTLGTIQGGNDAVWIRESKRLREIVNRFEC